MSVTYEDTERPKIRVIAILVQLLQNKRHFT